MIKKRRKEIYQPPYAQDLSGLGAIGQVKPMGTCENGTDPTSTWCTNGDSPRGNPSSDCSPTGNSPEYGGCNAGNDAMDKCNVGSTATF